jgi:hypothetical protein
VPFVRAGFVCELSVLEIISDPISVSGRFYSCALAYLTEEYFFIENLQLSRKFLFPLSSFLSLDLRRAFTGIPIASLLASSG